MNGPGENVVLLGAMGSGKSTVGRRLAERLGLSFVDTDVLVERAARRSIAQIFKEDGEPKFRSLERRAVAAALAGRRQVIATGGGSVLDPSTRARLKRAGITIWLQASPEAAADRLQGNGDRPLLATGRSVDTLRRLLAQREPYYREALMHVETSGRSVEDVTSAIVARLQPASTLVSVSAGAIQYDVNIGWGTLGCIGERLRGRHRACGVAVVTNPLVGRLYTDRVTTSLRASGFRPFVARIPDGERYKTLRTAGRLYDELVRRRFERGDLVLALGGGVIGDLAGFVAATYVRGVHYVQVPTTVVAQVDSSIGGKTGVDHRHGKNLIGAFHHPIMVDADVSTLGTLPRREFIAGLAEVVKYGVIADAALFAYLEDHVDAIVGGAPDVLVEMVRRSAAVKADVVRQDERESGLRRILNYGHTAGHVIETLTGYSAVRHGEGVAMGMDFAARLAARLGRCDETFVRRQRTLLERFGLPASPPKIAPHRAMDTMRLDKKVRDGQVHFVLPRAIGSVTVEPVTTQDILAVWRDAPAAKPRARRGRTRSHR
ncbi:MAG: 3-dehydroquinate synthase [Nitrospirota bacterium]